MKSKIVFLFMALSMICSSYSIADETSHRAAAEELLLLTNPDAMMQQVWGQVKGMMDQQFQQLGAPDDLKPLFEKYSDKMLEIISEELSFKNLKDGMITSYANTYTEEEILAISNFYKSPPGQAFLTKMPKLMQETMATTQKKMQPIMQKIQNLSKEMAEELKKMKEQKDGKV